jgi:hypothetical protein
MFAQMNAIGLNMSHYLTSDTRSTTHTATEVQELKFACPIIVSTTEGDVPPVEDTVAFEAWKEESLKRGEKELREKGYDGSFVLASVRPTPGDGAIAKPGRPMAEGEDVGAVVVTRVKRKRSTNPPSPMRKMRILLPPPERSQQRQVRVNLPSVYLTTLL